MADEPISNARLLAAPRARRCARWSAYTLVSGVVYFGFFVANTKLSLWPLFALAIVQSALGFAAVVLALLGRSDHPTPVGTVIIGLALGLVGALGVFVWFIAASLFTVGSSGGGGGFGFGAWGRPLRIRGREVHPRIEVEPDSEWCAGEAPDVAALSATAREALAAWWLLDAQKEHASVPAFARLAWQLVALGAPASLLERCYRAGLQEIDHARRCFALVSAYRGEPLGVLAMPELATDAMTIELATLAVESLVDGCFIEHLNADAAELAASRATDPVVSRLVADIARDERAHGDLAWDIVAWCIAKGDAAVVDALAERAASLPSAGSGLYDEALAALVARCELRDLHAHGRIPLADWPALYRARLIAVRERLARMLARELAHAA